MQALVSFPPIEEKEEIHDYTRVQASLSLGMELGGSWVGTYLQKGDMWALEEGSGEGAACGYLRNSSCILETIQGPDCLELLRADGGLLLQDLLYESHPFLACPDLIMA